MKKIKCVVLGAADAGKTSLLRRYFYKKFQPTRLPTVGSDFYTTKVQVENPSDHPTSPVTTAVLFHMWDTPGRERQRQEEEEHVDALLDAFVDRVDGIMLVYDSSSSTSFTKLRLIYAHWLLKTKNSTTKCPILVVGNKRDLSYTGFQKKQQQQQQQPLQLPASVPEQEHANENEDETGTINTIESVQSKEQQQQEQHRNVMGFDSFKGKDFRYEYKVYHDVHHTNSNSNASSATSLKNNTPPKKTTETNQTQQQQQSKQRKPPHPHHRHEISTFSSTAGSGSMWTQDFSQDGTYLDSLLSSEDRSNPDRDMVKLWCMRNGLQHIEVSALEEEGNVDQAMDMLLKLVLEYQERPPPPPLPLPISNTSETVKDTNNNNNNNNLHHHDPQQQHPLLTNATNNNDQSSSELTAATVIRPQQELDLHKRYGPKDNTCCFGIFPTLPTLWNRIVRTVKKQQ